MSELIGKYIDHVVKNILHDDAGINWVKNSIQGDQGMWALAVMRYAQVMGSDDSGYLAFRKKWAWKGEKVDKMLASDAGKLMLKRIGEVAAKFKAQDGMADYSLDRGSLRRDLAEQTRLWMGNWSVKKFAPELVEAMTNELDKGKYPDPPTEESGKKFFNFLRKVQLKPVRKDKDSPEKYSPTNAPPGLSDHGRLSAVDFVVLKKGQEILGADSSQIPKWKEKQDGGPSFAERLKTAVTSVNSDAGSTIFDGPLPSPEEPWHYTYMPIKLAEDKEN